MISIETAFQETVHHIRPIAVTGWGIMFICSMVLRCAGNLKTGFSLDQLQQIWQQLSYIAVNRWWTTLNLFTHSLQGKHELKCQRTGTCVRNVVLKTHNGRNVIISALQNININLQEPRLSFIIISGARNQSKRNQILSLCI